MIQTVETGRNIAFYQPGGACPAVVNRREGSVTTARRTEPVGLVGELGLVIRLQNEANHFLQQFARPGRETQWSHFPVLPGNVRPPDWRPSEPFEAQSPDDGVDLCQ